MILNKKELTLSEVSLHLMESWRLSSDELSRNHEVTSLEFPFSYPPISHPCTLLTIGTPHDLPLSSIRVSFTFEQRDQAPQLLKLNALVTSVQCILTPG